MGKGANAVTAKGDRLLTWEEVKQHSSKKDKWLVIDGNVYDITNWSLKHPGGSRVISHYAGQDASEAFMAFHNDKEFVRKYMSPIQVGRLVEKDAVKMDIQKDMLELRQTAEKMELFKPSATFFTLMLAHIVMFEVLSYVNMWYFGTSWGPYLLSVAFYTIVQGQAAWNMHDYGHLSVFRNTRLNHIFHLLTMSHIKGACSDWWNHLHYQHHSKPNVMDKDPDVRLDTIFVLGDEMPKRVAKANTSYMPYNWQHNYFFVIGPPLLFPLYFQYMTFRHAITRRKWEDLAWMLSFYVKMFALYTPLLGLWGACKFYFIIRCLESHWFVWVSQSNHIPMEIDDDKERPWLALQLTATCNVEKSPFNDWFTGHLNFQIEHHLFPTMPRHNLYKIAPMVRTLCKRHNIPYIIKPLGTAFADVIRSLKSSGQIWESYYHAYNFH